MARADIFEEGTEFDVADTELDQPTEVEADQPDTEELSKEDKQAQADAEHMPAVEKFKAAVEAAVEAADSSTGTVFPSDLDQVVKAYRDVSGGIKYKNLAKSYVDDKMKAALPAKEYIRAVSYNEVAEGLKTAAPAPKAAKPKADPRIAFGQRLAALELAREVLEETATEDLEGYEVPATGGAFEEVTAWLEWNKQPIEERGESPDLSPLAADTLKLVQGKGLGKRVSGTTRAPFSGTRRNVAAHIESAFVNVPSGEFLTVSEIVNHDSNEYGDDHPSSGAVSARLFPASGNMTVAGIEPGVNSEGVKGATKL